MKPYDKSNLPMNNFSYDLPYYHKRKYKSIAISYNSYGYKYIMVIVYYINKLSRG